MGSSLSKLALGLLALVAASSSALAEEQLYASHFQRQYMGGARIPLMEELRVPRRGGRVTSVFVIASSERGRGQVQISLDGFPIADQIVGTDFVAVQAIVNRDVRMVGSIELMLRGNITVAMMAVGFEDGFPPGPPPPPPPPPFPPGPPGPPPPPPPPFPPGPPLPPGPPPGPPPRPQISVMGRLEATSFNFVARDLAELFARCKDFHVANRVGSIDDMDVSVNGSAPEHLRNDASYWKTASSACLQVAIHARAVLGADPSWGSTRTVVAVLEETIEFEFTGFDRQDLIQSCVRQYDAQGLSGRSIDDMDVSVDFMPSEKMRNNASYWRDSFSLCMEIAKAIR